MADDPQIDKLEAKISFFEGQVRAVERDRRWINRVPWLLLASCPLGIAWSWAGAFASVVCIATLWFMGLYILKFRREEYEGDIRDLRAEIERRRALPAG